MINTNTYNKETGSFSLEEYTTIEKALKDPEIIKMSGIIPVTRNSPDIHVSHAITNEGETTMVFERRITDRKWDYTFAGNTPAIIITKQRLEEMLEKSHTL
ncbi:hypothetical protein J4466_00645 [Candidatus Pacearchaeota archaeon]|nr:hypothetical protein [Candidatus Pacearchaeota archaeon]